MKFHLSASTVKWLMKAIGSGLLIGFTLWQPDLRVTEGKMVIRPPSADQVVDQITSAFAEKWSSYTKRYASPSYACRHSWQPSRRSLGTIDRRGLIVIRKPRPAHSMKKSLAFWPPDCQCLPDLVSLFISIFRQGEKLFNEVPCLISGKFLGITKWPLWSGKKLEFTMLSHVELEWLDDRGQVVEQYDQYGRKIAVTTDDQGQYLRLLISKDTERLDRKSPTGIDLWPWTINYADFQESLSRITLSFIYIKDGLVYSGLPPCALASS